MGVKVAACTQSFFWFINKAQLWLPHEDIQERYDMKENLQNFINPKVYLEALEWEYIVVIDRASLTFQNELDTIAKTNKEPNRNTNKV